MLIAILAVQPERAALSGLHARSWDAMCSYAHTGELQIQRWNTDDAIEPSHSDEEILEALDFTGRIALMAALNVALVTGLEDLSEELAAEADKFPGESRASKAR